MPDGEEGPEDDGEGGYERMLKSELELTEEIDALLGRADEIDSGEDERFGKDQRHEDLPAELRRRESRLEKIREAKKRLEAEAAEARARALREFRPATIPARTTFIYILVGDPREEDARIGRINAE